MGQTWVPTFCERQSSFEFFFLISERSAKMPARTRSVAAAESDEVVDSNVNNNKACKRRKSRSRSRGKKYGSRSRSRRSKSKGKKSRSKSRGKSTTRVKAHCVKAHKVRSHRVKSHTRKLSKSPKRCGKK